MLISRMWVKNDPPGSASKRASFDSPFFISYPAAHRHSCACLPVGREAEPASHPMRGIHNRGDAGFPFTRLR